MKLECRIAEMRHKHKMTQAEVAEKSGISISQISLFENNKSTPSVPNLWSISRAIGCRVDSLYKIVK